jgi:hypothetical protein
MLATIESRTVTAPCFGVVGPTRARFTSADWREEVGTTDAGGRGPRLTFAAVSKTFSPPASRLINQPLLQIRNQSAHCDVESQTNIELSCKVGIRFHDGTSLHHRPVGQCRRRPQLNCAILRAGRPRQTVGAKRRKLSALRRGSVGAVTVHPGGSGDGLHPR